MFEKEWLVLGFLGWGNNHRCTETNLKLFFFSFTFYCLNLSIAATKCILSIQVSDEECCVWTKKNYCNFKNNFSCNQPTKMTTNKKVLMSLKLNLKPKNLFVSETTTKRQRKFLCVTKKKILRFFFFGKNSSDYLEREKK
jgi:hypothetical protein